METASRRVSSDPLGSVTSTVRLVALDTLTAPQPQVMALGFFDGVHLGHQRIIATAVARARAEGVPAALFTFSEPPKRVLRPESAPQSLTTFEEKLEVLSLTDLDQVVWCPFTREFSRLAPDVFVRDVVVGRMGAIAVVAGPNYHFGVGARGDVVTLDELGRGVGLGVEVVAPVEVGDVLVSSTRIRARIADGHVEEAAALLGRPYRALADVVHGDARGRSLGYPTANLEVPPEKLLPASGVYAVRARIDDVTYGGVANMGVRPTFGEHQKTLEVHLLDVSLDLYGRRVRLDFIRRLRGERRFEDAAALVGQIGHDVEAAREVLGA